MVAILAAAALALQLDTSADAALPCPANQALLLALQQRTGIHLGPAQASLDVHDGAWRLRLRRGGSLLLQRTLPLPRQDCALLAETAALVIDRYFAELPAPARQRRPQRLAALGPVAEPSSPPAPAPAVAAEPPVAATAAPTPVPIEAARAVLIPAMPAVSEEAGDPEAAPQLVISAGIAALDDLRPGLWLQAERRWRTGSASFLVIAGGADRDAGPTREVELQTALMALSIGPCFERYVRACVAPLAGVRAQTTSGRTLHPQPSVRFTPELGALVSVDRAVYGRLHAGASLMVGYLLGEDALEAAGPSEEIDYAASLHVGMNF
jgi:hypothetical protein